MINYMKELYTIVKKELREDENIWITTKSKLNSKVEDNWKFDEFTSDQLFNVYSGKEKVNRYWHEDGLCIILNR